MACSLRSRNRIWPPHFRFLLKLEVSGHKQLCKWVIVVLAMLSIAAGDISGFFNGLA